MNNFRENMAHYFGEIVFSLRREKHMKQEDLALQTGISRRTIRRIEKGEACTDFVSMYIICAALGERWGDVWQKN